MPNAAAAEYRTKVTKPDDFDAFWDDVLRDASAVPLEAELIPDPLRTSDDVEVFQAHAFQIVVLAGLFLLGVDQAFDQVMQLVIFDHHQID